MSGDDGLESRGIQRAGFDELEEAGLVLSVDAVGLHLVDRGDDFSDVHTGNTSGGQHRVKFFQDVRQHHYEP